MFSFPHSVLKTLKYCSNVDGGPHVVPACFNVPENISPNYCKCRTFQVVNFFHSIRSKIMVVKLYTMNKAADMIP